MAFDPILRWKKSPSLDVSKYSVAWMLDGVPAGAGDVVKEGSSEIVGYSVRFSAHNPGVVLLDGAVIGASVRAFDASGLASGAVDPAPVTVPSEPPAVPEEVTLAIS